MKEKLTDSELIAMVNGGNQQAFSELMKRYRKMVARVVIGMLGDTPEADDVGQEVFVRFYQSISSFRGDSALGTYLTRIAINLSLNELNSRKRRFLFFSVKDDEQPLPDLADEANVDESLSVITSYSIHYTKLYETLSAKCLVLCLSYSPRP